MYTTSPFHALRSIARQGEEEGLIGTLVVQDGKEASPLGVTGSIGGESSRRRRHRNRRWLKVRKGKARGARARSYIQEKRVLGRRHVHFRLRHAFRNGH